MAFALLAIAKTPFLHIIILFAVIRKTEVEYWSATEVFIDTRLGIDIRKLECEGSNTWNFVPTASYPLWYVTDIYVGDIGFLVPLKKKLKARIK